MCLLIQRGRLLRDFCSSSQRFACGFLQIPPRDGHPCRPANSSRCRACRGLAPPSNCALPGAHNKSAENSPRMARIYSLIGQKHPHQDTCVHGRCVKRPPIPNLYSRYLTSGVFGAFLTTRCFNHWRWSPAQIGTDTCVNCYQSVASPPIGSRKLNKSAHTPAQTRTPLHRMNRYAALNTQYSFLYPPLKTENFVLR